ncbi:hypothetical protein ACET3Z_022884 [Daucus carota]
MSSVCVSLPLPAKTPLKPININPNFKPPNFDDNLIHLANTAQIHKAIHLITTHQHKLTPDLNTYSTLLKSCIRTRNFDLGKLLHNNLISSGLVFDDHVIMLNSLITLYSKSGDLVTAKCLFDSMGDRRDLVSWSAIISGFAHNGMERESVCMFVDMIKSGERPNQFCFSGVIHACCSRGNVDVGLGIFGFVIKTGYFEADLCVGCALIDLFAKGLGDMKLARVVFDRMPERNAVTWTLMITRYAQMGFSGDALELFLSMVENGFVADRFTFSSVISGCAELGWLDVGKQLHSLVVKSGLSTDVCVGCSLLDMYAKSGGSLIDSRNVFNRMSEQNIMSWTAMITGYVLSGGFDREAIEMYIKMIESRVLPNEITFSSLLKACGNLADTKAGEQIYSNAVKLGFSSVNCVGNSLVSMYARSGSIEDAQKAFEILFEKNLISYNILVDAYAKNLNSDEAFDIFNQIEDTEIGVDAFTYASLLSGAASVGAVGKGEQLHARLLKSGFESNQFIRNALISMYSKCGNIVAAYQVFDDMEDRNVISWTSIITGFAKHGLAKRAREMFEQMLLAGVKPNDVTYVAVLSACSHAGLMDEGWKHFNNMYKEHGINPKMEHYACIVDLLGRLGYLESAVQFIESMPYTADPLVWRTLLGACHVHRNTEIGKYAAEMILKQDPSDPAAHVLLSNLYASKSQWDHVTEIRKGMKQRNVVKEVGCSWIETGNTVHKFYVGDTSHPQARDIYGQLDQLAVKIKKLGYIPDTNFVLHNVVEEQKEQYLFQHSEKIAVAFGLISTAKPKPIRIFKNLRICGDCHTAMKYISLATGRDIVVRDSNRFHHFVDGSCSCNEYW